MTKKLLMLADLGHLKTYRLQESEQFSTPRLQLIDEWQTNVPNHLSQEVTDQAGQYRKGSVPSGPSDLSDGEEHNLHLERRRRAVKAVARHMTELIGRQEEFDGCYFAAPSEVNKAILKALDRATRSQIQKNVAANLTRLNNADVIAHFCD
jgi:hypothetical protein